MIHRVVKIAPKTLAQAMTKGLCASLAMLACLNPLWGVESNWSGLHPWSQQQGPKTNQDYRESYNHQGFQKPLVLIDREAPKQDNGVDNQGVYHLQSLFAPMQQHHEETKETDTKKLHTSETKQAQQNQPTDEENDRLSALRDDMKRSLVQSFGTTEKEAMDRMEAGSKKTLERQDELFPNNSFILNSEYAAFLDIVRKQRQKNIDGHVDGQSRV